LEEEGNWLYSMSSMKGKKMKEKQENKG
jgi:hypothetical protein